MSLHTEHLNQHKMNRVFKAIVETNLPVDMFLTNILSKSFIETNNISLSDLLSNLEKNTFAMNEAWWNPFSWFTKKQAARPAARPEPKEEPVYNYPSVSTGKTSYIGRTPAEARAMAGHGEGRKLAGGAEGEKAVKDAIKSFLLGKDGSVDEFVAKLHMPNASINKIAMVKHLAKALVKFLDKYEFKYDVITDKAAKDKFKSEHEQLMNKMESRLLSSALGFAGDVVADFDKFSGAQQSSLYNKISAMAEGKFKPEDISRIEMSGHSQESVSKVAKKALDAIETKKGMGKIGDTAPETKTEVPAPEEKDLGPEPVDLSGKKSKSPQRDAEAALRKQKLGSMGSLEDYFRFFRFKKGEEMHQVENEAELMDAIKNKKLNKIAVISQLRSAAEKAAPKVASDLNRVADQIKAM